MGAAHEPKTQSPKTNDVGLDSCQEPIKRAAEREAMATEDRLSTRLAVGTVAFSDVVLGAAVQQDVVMWNLVPETEATVRCTVHGEGFSLAPPAQSQVLPYLSQVTEPRPAAVVRFAPTRSGKAVGVMQVESVWTNGSSERHAIELVGWGRTLSEAPHREVAAEEVSPEAQARECVVDGRAAKEAKRTDPPPENERVKFESARDAACLNIDTVIESQRSGVGTLSKESEAYDKARPDPPSDLWLDLLQVGLTLATAGVAAQLVKYTIKQLGSENVADVVSAGVEQALILAGRDAFQKVSSGSAGGPAGGQFSTNYACDFFAFQDAILIQQRKNALTQVREEADRLRSYLRDQPQAATQAMAALAKASAATVKEAHDIQANAMAPLYAAMIARAAGGSEKIRTADGEAVVATKLQAVPAKDARGQAATIDGVLDILVDKPLSPLRVVGARLHGVSAEIAGRLIEAPLAAVPMSIRLVLGPALAQPTVVTRDDAGRIRISDDFQTIGDVVERSERASTEAEAHQGATKLFESVLGKTLHDWGVSSIEHDDATGPTR